MSGELSPELVRAGFEQAGIVPPRPKRNDEWTPEPLVRPPVLCAGCPHTSAFMAVRATGARVAGDIGCYTLACLDPLRGMDTTVSMGSSIGNAVGMAKAGETKPVVATIGDSTFLHAGIPQLINAVYNQANITVMLLDNHITAMTGGQQHPGTGKTLRGEAAPAVDYEALVRAIGVKWVRKVDSYDLAAMHQSLRDAINYRGVAVLIADRPCVLDPVKIKGPPFAVVQEQCNACQACMNLGCPAITWSEPIVRGPAQGADRPVAVHRLHAVRAGLHRGLHQDRCTGDAMSGPATTVRPAAWPKSSALKVDAAEDACNVLIVGVGGQGVIMVSKVLALLAQTQGFEVKQSEVHGMAKRGGSVFSHVRFGERVWSPTIPKGEVDILVALEWAEGLRWLPFLKPGGIFICDTKRIVPPFACLNRHPGAPMRYSKETPAEVIAHVAEGYAIDATDMAEHSATNARQTSSCSARCRRLWILLPEDWERTVAEFVPKKTIAVNLEAFRRGRAWIDEARNVTPPVEAPARTQVPAEAAYNVRLEINPAWCKSCDICVKMCPERCLRLERRAHRRAGRSPRNAPAAGCANGCVPISPSACISMREPLRREALAQ